MKWESERCGKRVAKKGGGAENGNARKIAPKRTGLAFGDASWGLPAHVKHFWKALFRDNISIADLASMLNRLKVIEVQS